MAEEKEYSLPQCICIASTPLVFALAVAYFAEPSGELLFDWRPLSWMVDYVLILPLVWFGGEMLRAGQVIDPPQPGLPALKMGLRLTGGLLLIYLFVWLMAVPLIGQFAVSNPGLGIDPPSYSQVFRFLIGVAGALAISIWRARQRVKKALSK